MPASAQREREKICVPHRDSSRMYCVMSGDDAGSVRVCARRRPSRGTHRSALRGLPQPTEEFPTPWFTGFFAWSVVRRADCGVV